MLRGPLFHESWDFAGTQAHLPGPSQAGLEQAVARGHRGELATESPSTCTAGRGMRRWARRWACPAERAWAQGGDHPELLNPPDPARGALLGPELG